MIYLCDGNFNIWSVIRCVFYASDHRLYVKGLDLTVLSRITYTVFWAPQGLVDLSNLSVIKWYNFSYHLMMC